MEFLVEDGSGLQSATSYCSLDFADSYLGIDLNQTGWNENIAPEAREFLLMRATETLDLFYTWRGQRQSYTQALDWPRKGVKTAELGQLPVDAVPVAVQRATAALAATLYTSDPFEPLGTTGFKRIEVDVIKLEIDRQDKPSALPPKVLRLLREYGHAAQPRSRFVQIGGTWDSQQ